MKNLFSVSTLFLITLSITSVASAHPGHGDHGTMHFGLLKIAALGLFTVALIGGGLFVAYRQNKKLPDSENRGELLDK